MEKISREEYPTNASYDLCDLVIGGKIGEGCHRDVYEYLPDKSCVIKVDKSGQWENIKEWEVWQQVQWTDYGKWFAPCVAISVNGIYLVQKKAKPLHKPPKEIPAFFMDVKDMNWGYLDGKPVCFDYSLQLQAKIDGKKMKKWKTHWFSV